MTASLHAAGNEPRKSGGSRLGTGHRLPRSNLPIDIVGDDDIITIRWSQRVSAPTLCLNLEGVLAASDGIKG